MSKSAEIELNSAGVKRLMKSAEVENILVSRAASVAGRCEDGRVGQPATLSTRVVVSVWSSNKDNCLIKAL